MSIPEIDRPSQLTQALLRRLCTPEALDPTNPVHRTGFARALQHDPTLPAPRHLLSALDDRELWHIVQQPPASAELQRRLRDPAARVGTPIRDDEIPRTPLFPSLEAVIISAYRERRLQLRDIERLKKRFSLRPVTLCALTDIARRREPRRRSRALVPAPPSLVDMIHALLPSNGSGAYWRLWDLPLERLTPQELAPLLSQWSKMSHHYVAALLNVPGLDADTQALAFHAWIETHCYRNPRQPLPLHLIEATRTSMLPSVLRLFLRGHIDIMPSPTRTQLDNLLLLVTLDDPETATDLRHAITLAAWRDTLCSLIEADLKALTATDPDARWLAISAKEADMDREKAIQLCAQFNQESPARQRALAPIMLISISFESLI